MNCEFESAETAGIYACRLCGYTTRIPRDDPPKRNCPTLADMEPQSLSAPLPCIHQGAALREELCKLCGARERLVPIYACALHGECTLTRTKSGTDYRCCLTCDDRQTLDSPAASAEN